MAAHDVGAGTALGLRAGQHGDDVDEMRGLRHARAGLDEMIVERHLEAIAPAALELLEDQAPRRADAARGRLGVRKRVARAERHQLADVRLDALRGNLRQHLVDGIRLRQRGNQDHCRHRHSFHHSPFDVARQPITAAATSMREDTRNGAPGR